MDGGGMAVGNCEVWVEGKAARGMRGWKNGREKCQERGK